MLTHCEREQVLPDMCINVKKSCCLRVGPRYDKICCHFVLSAGNSLLSVKRLRYLGIFIVSSRLFKCAFDQAKQTYYRCLNAIFGKIGRIASEEVVLQLVSSKCLPVLMYGTEACHMTKSDINSLDLLSTASL
jgi:hypothetical protein